MIASLLVVVVINLAWYLDVGYYIFSIYNVEERKDLSYGFLIHYITHKYEYPGCFNPPFCSFSYQLSYNLN